MTNATAIIVAINSNNPWDITRSQEPKWAMEPDQYGVICWTHDAAKAKRFDSEDSAKAFIAERKPKWDIERFETV